MCYLTNSTHLTVTSALAMTNFVMVHLIFLILTLTKTSFHISKTYFTVHTISSLLHHNHKICSPSKFTQQLQFFKIIAWNGSLLMKHFNQQHLESNDNENNVTDTNGNTNTLVRNAVYWYKRRTSITWT